MNCSAIRDARMAFSDTVVLDDVSRVFRLSIAVWLAAVMNKAICKRNNMRNLAKIILALI